MFRPGQGIPLSGAANEYVLRSAFYFSALLSRGTSRSDHTNDGTLPSALPYQPAPTPVDRLRVGLSAPVPLEAGRSARTGTGWRDAHAVSPWRSPPFVSSRQPKVRLTIITGLTFMRRYECSAICPRGNALPDRHLLRRRRLKHMRSHEFCRPGVTRSCRIVKIQPRPQLNPSYFERCLQLRR